MFLSSDAQKPFLPSFHLREIQPTCGIESITKDFLLTNPKRKTIPRVASDVMTSYVTAVRAH